MNPTITFRPTSVSACQTTRELYVFSFLVNPARPIEATSKICGKNWMKEGVFPPSKMVKKSKTTKRPLRKGS